jgi:hypothetical protein
MLPRKRQRNMQLLPELSARENLSRMLVAAVGDWDLPRLPALMGKFRDTEVVKDLIWDHYLHAYQNFMAHKVMEHKYNRRFSFYLNVRSSVMGSWTHIRDKYWRLDDEKFASTSVHAPVDDAEYGDFLASHEPLLYRSHGEYKHIPLEEHKAWHRAQLLKEWYQDYLLECKELEVTPVKFERYVQLNRGDDYEACFVELALKCSNFSQLQKRRETLERKIRRRQIHAERESRGVPSYISLLYPQD